VTISSGNSSVVAPVDELDGRALAAFVVVLASDAILDEVDGFAVEPSPVPDAAVSLPAEALDVLLDGAPRVLVLDGVSRHDDVEVEALEREREQGGGALAGVPTPPVGLAQVAGDDAAPLAPVHRQLGFAGEVAALFVVDRSTVRGAWRLATPLLAVSWPDRVHDAVAVVPVRFADVDVLASVPEVLEGPESCVLDLLVAECVVREGLVALPEVDVLVGLPNEMQAFGDDGLGEQFAHDDPSSSVGSSVGFGTQSGSSSTSGAPPASR